MPELGLIDYTLIRSSRKTLSLQINDDANLVVRAPKNLPITEIDAFILDKANWIEKKQAVVKSRHLPKAKYQAGELFLYLGQYYPLATNNHKQGLYFDGECFSASAFNREDLLKFYKAKFLKIAIPRLKYYAEHYQFDYQQIRLKKQKTIWGSCSANNNINLNYLLIQAPMTVIDYVVVHELAHTKIKNHSKAFWQLVESILPDYQASKNWLKKEGFRLKQVL